MEILGIGPGREVGEAYRFLLELRLDHGPMGEDAARAALLEWWQRAPLTPLRRPVTHAATRPACRCTSDGSARG